MLAEMRDLFRAELAGELAPVTRVALVDFPNHTDAGDLLLWLGQGDALPDTGVDVVAVGRRRISPDAEIDRGARYRDPLFPGQQLAPGTTMAPLPSLLAAPCAA